MKLFRRKRSASRPGLVTKERKGLRTFLVWVVLVLAFAVLYRLSAEPARPYQEFAHFLADVEAGQVREIRVVDNRIDVDPWHAGEPYYTLGVIDRQLTQRLSDAGTLVHHGAEKSFARSVLVMWFPLLLFIGLWIFFMKRMSGGGTGNWMSLAKSRARLLQEEAGATFADVGGCEDAKTQLGDLIDFLKHPQRWLDAGVRLPRGVLLEGPPGCGKTLLARAVAGETDAKFYLASGSEFVELVVGVGAARVRDMFEAAAKNAPAVIFIDELDAIGRRRGSGLGPGNEEREQTLNQLLVSMDGFAGPDRVVVIGATNRSDVLDPALMRPGRFDRRVRIPPLDFERREQVLGIHTRNKKLAEDVSLPELARRTDGRSGAELEGLVNEAGLLAVRRCRREGGDPVLRAADFDEVLRPSETRPLRFDHVDALLIESTTQLSRPVGRARVRLTLRQGSVVEGELVWADAAFVKLHDEGGSGDTIVPKAQIETLETLDGAGEVDPAEVASDVLARRPGDL